MERKKAANKKRKEGEKKSGVYFKVTSWNEFLYKII